MPNFAGNGALEPNNEDRLRRKHNSVIRNSNTGGSSNVPIVAIYHNSSNGEGTMMNSGVLSPTAVAGAHKHAVGARSGSSLALDITPKKLSKHYKHQGKHHKSDAKNVTPEFDHVLP